MMLTEQVFFEQVNDRQVYLSVFRSKSLEISEILQINKRFGSLLYKERRAVGYSSGRVAREFSLNSADLKNWELGIESPPAKVFLAIIRYYGTSAFLRAAELDMEIQIEKYKLVFDVRNNSQGLGCPICAN